MGTEAWVVGLVGTEAWVVGPVDMEAWVAGPVGAEAWVVGPVGAGDAEAQVAKATMAARAVYNPPTKGTRHKGDFFSAW